DQPLDDDALNIKMDTMTLMADSSSLKASNILVPLTNDDRIISDKSPLKTNYSTATTTNIFLSSDNVLMSDLSMEENHPHDDDFEDRLTKLRRDHEERMKEYDDKIQHFEKKINKVCKQIKKMGRDMKNVMIEKEEKQQEFLNLLNEYTRLSKTDNLPQLSFAGSVTRITNTIVLAPVERVKCLLQAQEAAKSNKNVLSTEYNGSFDCARQFYRKGGIQNLY
ncbi:unnamed protein product, partial [Rotaria sordida]